MDAKAKFFARMDASFQAEGKMMEEPALEAEDFDIDFGVSESGRTMVLEKYGGDDSTLGDMDFSMTNSGRLTVEMANTPVRCSLGRIRHKIVSWNIRYSHGLAEGQKIPHVALGLLCHVFQLSQDFAC